MSNDDDPRRLRNAQATIRDRFVDAESGLFTMNCVAGAGKSLTMQRIAAASSVVNDMTATLWAGVRSPRAYRRMMVSAAIRCIVSDLP
ncbi:hypothetical protein, partial [Halorubrum sp. ASP121]|uniref:hypothetical protein n=1 Tax=Halorubrum sp. ASP121 TaxID=1855858 RepID=UPI001A7E0B1C